MQAEKTLLHHVLRLAHAADHAVGDGKGRGTKLVELLVVHRSAETLHVAEPPARIVRLPAELALGLCVRRTPRLGHHDRCRLAAPQSSEPAWDMPRRLGIECARQGGQPLSDRRWLVVDNIVDTWLAVFDRGDGGGGG